MGQVIDWAELYARLHTAGYSDAVIAVMAGVTRAVVNAVRNRTYVHNHEPGYEGGCRIVAAAKNLTK